VWLKCAPRRSRSSRNNLRMDFDHLLRILGQIVQFRAEYRRRKATSFENRGSGSATESVQTEKAMSDWIALHEDLENLKNRRESTSLPISKRYDLKFLPSFGHTVVYNTHALACWWAQVYMARILLRRVHPDIPTIASAAVTSAEIETEDDALMVGRIIADIIPLDARIVHPATQGVLIESTMPLFIAGMQYKNFAQRSWIVKAFETIERCTGWMFAKQASLAIRQLWKRVDSVGRGWQLSKNAPLEPRLSDSASFSRPSLEILGEYWLVGDEYEASDLVIPCGDTQEVRDTSLSQNENPGYPQTETTGTIETKFEDESYGDVIQEPMNATDPSSGFPFHRSRKPVQRWPGWICKSRDSGICMDPNDEPLKNSPSPESWAVSLTGEALPPNIEDSASPLSDVASTDNSSFESEISMSTEEENLSSAFESARHRVVERVMSHFYAIFQAMPAVSHRGHEESQTCSSQTASNYSTQTSSSTSGFVSPLHTMLGKHSRQNNAEDRSDEEDGRPPKRPNKEKKKIEPKTLKRKFACPYFKRDSEKYMTRRSCVGPGWDEVRRVK
jgi:hypothetical protein